MRLVIIVDSRQIESLSLSLLAIKFSELWGAFTNEVALFQLLVDNVVFTEKIQKLYSISPNHLQALIFRGITFN